jgi:hypothetical protein
MAEPRNFSAAGGFTWKDKGYSRLHGTAARENCVRGEEPRKTTERLEMLSGER